MNSHLAVIRRYRYENAFAFEIEFIPKNQFMRVLQLKVISIKAAQNEKLTKRLLQQWFRVFVFYFDGTELIKDPREKRRKRKEQVK